jgi:hypothetical protein
MPQRLNNISLFRNRFKYFRLALFFDILFQSIFFSNEVVSGLIAFMNNSPLIIRLIIMYNGLLQLIRLAFGIAAFLANSNFSLLALFLVFYNLFKFV